MASSHHACCCVKDDPQCGAGRTDCPYPDVDSNTYVDNSHVCGLFPDTLIASFSGVSMPGSIRLDPPLAFYSITPPQEKPPDAEISLVCFTDGEQVSHDQQINQTIRLTELLLCGNWVGGMSPNQQPYAGPIAYGRAESAPRVPDSECVDMSFWRTFQPVPFGVVPVGKTPAITYYVSAQKTSSTELRINVYVVPHEWTPWTGNRLDITRYNPAVIRIFKGTLNTTAGDCSFTPPQTVANEITSSGPMGDEDIEQLIVSSRIVTDFPDISLNPDGKFIFFNLAPGAGGAIANGYTFDNPGNTYYDYNAGGQVTISSCCSALSVIQSLRVQFAGITFCTNCQDVSNALSDGDGNNVADFDYEIDTTPLGRMFDCQRVYGSDISEFDQGYDAVFYGRLNDALIFKDYASNDGSCSPVSSAIERDPMHFRCVVRFTGNAMEVRLVQEGDVDGDDFGDPFFRRSVSLDADCTPNWASGGLLLTNEITSTPCGGAITGDEEDMGYGGTATVYATLKNA